MDWENWRDTDQVLTPAADAVGQRKERRLLQLALLLSLALHGVLAVLLLRGQSGQQAAPVDDSPVQFVRINLLPDNPQRREPAPITESEPEAVAETPPQAIDQAEPQALAEAEPTPEAAPESPAPQADQSSDPEQDPTIPATNPRSLIELPSVDVVRSSVEQIDNARRSQLWLRDCNRRQEENELLDCDPGEQADYSAARENETYTALQPVRELTRSERSLSTIAVNRDALAGRLLESAVPDELAEYLLQQTDAAISLGSQTGNRTVEHMIEMTDKSAAAEQARRVLGDAWIETQSRRLQQRRAVDP